MANSQPSIYNILRRGDHSVDSETPLQLTALSNPFTPGKETSVDPRMFPGSDAYRGVGRGGPGGHGSNVVWRPGSSVPPANNNNNAKGGKGKKGANSTINNSTNSNTNNTKQQQQQQQQQQQKATTNTNPSKKNKNKNVLNTDIVIPTNTVTNANNNNTGKGKKDKEVKDNALTKSSTPAPVVEGKKKKKDKKNAATASNNSVLGEPQNGATIASFEVDVALQPVDPRYFGQLVQPQRRLVVSGVTFENELALENLLLPISYCVSSQHWHENTLWQTLEEDAEEELVLKSLEAQPGKPRIEYSLSALAPLMGSGEQNQVPKHEALDTLVHLTDGSFVAFLEAFHKDSKQEAAAVGSIHSMGNIKTIPVASAAVLEVNNSKPKKQQQISATTTAKALLLQSSQLDKGMVAMVKNTPHGLQKGFGLGLGIGAVDLKTMRLPIIEELIKKENKKNQPRPAKQAPAPVVMKNTKK